jgi:hypothetical protein
MCNAKTCHQCGQCIAINQQLARIKNPRLGEIGYIYFHQRGRGDCYWQYLRDTVIKAQRSARAA